MDEGIKLWIESQIEEVEKLMEECQEDLTDAPALSTSRAEVCAVVEALNKELTTLAGLKLFLKGRLRFAK